MKKFLKILFALIFIVFLFSELLVMPIIDITNKNDRKILNIIYAKEILEVEHSVNYIIPFGKDYYYIGIDEDYNAYLIHAPKKWAENNFTELSQIASQQEELTFPLGYSECLELTYIKDAVMKIVSGILTLILAVVGIANYKKKSELPRIAVNIYVIMAIITITLMLIAII